MSLKARLAALESRRLGPDPDRPERRALADRARALTLALPEPERSWVLAEGEPRTVRARRAAQLLEGAWAVADDEPADVALAGYRWAFKVKT